MLQKLQYCTSIACHISKEGITFTSISNATASVMPFFPKLLHDFALHKLEEKKTSNEKNSAHIKHMTKVILP
jgi:hypothetical protein